MDFKDDFNTPRIIQFPKIQDPKGNLTFIQNPDHVPFEIKRTFWTYDIPGGEIRKCSYVNIRQTACICFLFLASTAASASQSEASSCTSFSSFRTFLSALNIQPSVPVQALRIALRIILF